MSVSYVSKVEQGLTSPTAIALFKMSYILKTPMEEFFKGIDYEKLSSWNLEKQFCKYKLPMRLFKNSENLEQN